MEIKRKKFRPPKEIYEREMPSNPIELVKALKEYDDLNRVGVNLQTNMSNLWDVQNVINKMKNVVLNYTEMEIKVREATNNDKWGASSTLMQEIAQGTYRFDQYNEIMAMIYKRISETSKWRLVYKSLTLLEYLIKNGSDKVVDYAREHIYDLKALKNFAFIDEKGKDQGLNVRNRAKEIVNLLGDNNLIQEERRKAKENKNKYIGVSNSGGSSSNRATHEDYSSYQDDDDYRQPESSNFDSVNKYDSKKYDTSKYDTEKYESSTKFESRKDSFSEQVQATSTKPIKENCLLDFDHISSNDDFADFQSASLPSAIQRNQENSNKDLFTANSAKAASAKKTTSGSQDLFGDFIDTNSFKSDFDKSHSKSELKPQILNSTTPNFANSASPNFTNSVPLSATNFAKSPSPTSTNSPQSNFANFEVVSKSKKANELTDFISKNSNLVSLSGDLSSANKTQQAPAMNALQKGKVNY